MSGVVDPREVLDETYQAELASLERALPAPRSFLDRVRFAHRRRRLIRRIYGSSHVRSW